MKKLNLFILGLMLLSFTIVSANTETYKVNTLTNLKLTCTIDNAIPSASTTMNLTVAYPNGTLFLDNVGATALGSGIFNYTTTFPTIGTYYPTLLCIDGAESNSNSDGLYEITPTGLQMDNVGEISASILYFYIILGFGFIGLGYLFLRNKSLWISYVGLFIMLIGFAFIYYDLHLTNLYATTIALNSGASNVTTGAFIMFTRFIKLAPYFVAGLIAFFSVKTLRDSINIKKQSDGWDKNSY